MAATAHNDPPTYLPTPSYSPSEDPPSYAPEALPDESRVLYSPRPASNLSLSPDAPVYTNKSKKGDVTLNLATQISQDIPTYGRNAIIQGSVSVDYKPAQISSINVRVQGIVTYTITNDPDMLGDARHNGVNMEHKIVELESQLWARPSSSSSSSSTSAPSLPDTLPFAFRLPTKCSITRNGRTAQGGPLPPTFSGATSSSSSKYRAIFSDAEPRFQAQVVYHVVVVVELLKLFGSKTVRFATVFNYHPRSIAASPTLLPPVTFLGTMKSAPEEWAQSKSLIKPQDPASLLAPLELFLAVPKGHIYPLNMPIPFHIQLQGPQSSLEAFLGPPSSHGHSSAHGPWRNDDVNIRLSFTRKTGVVFNGRDYGTIVEGASLGPREPLRLSSSSRDSQSDTESRYRDDECGTWRFVPASELLSNDPGTSQGHPTEERNLDWNILAWEGTIIPSPAPCQGSAKAVATFNACDVYVKDFLGITLTPCQPPDTPQNSSSKWAATPFKVHRHMVSIALVTEHFDHRSL